MPDVVDGTFQEKEFRDVLFEELEIPVAAEVGDVVHAASDEVVNADDLVAAREEEIGQVRAEEAGGTGDHGDGL